MARASDNILTQIEAAKRELSGDTLRDLKKSAKRLNVTVDSLVWLLTPVYTSGHYRSNAYADCPRCVIDDGLAVERLGSTLAYTPWMMTDKAKAIVKH